LTKSQEPAQYEERAVRRPRRDGTRHARGAHVRRHAAAAVPTIGKLAPWQKRRAKELLAANLAGGVTLGELASVCELSIRHFNRAFRESMGMSPHAWLVHYRVEKAKGLLTNSPRVLADIALDCGFADQSHFTRMFQRMTGISPGRRRRLYRR
jgi:AraC family transcriptional regulator